MLLQGCSPWMACVAAEIGDVVVQAPFSLRVPCLVARRARGCGQTTLVVDSGQVAGSVLWARAWGILGVVESGQEAVVVMHALFYGLCVG